MRIVVLGAGAVGFNLASALGREGHEIAVIERRPDMLARVRERLDVQVVEGNGTSVKVLEEAGTGTADLFIGVTESDEINMVACALAQALGAGRRFARVRNRDFTGKEPVLSKSAFGISRLIDPDGVTVRALVESITAPGVTDVAEFADGEILLRGTVLEEGSPLLDRPLAELRAEHADIPFLIAAISREGSLSIPAGDTVLREKDQIFLILRRDGLPRLGQFVGDLRSRVRRVVVYGASRIGLLLCEELRHRVDQVVLIEPDERVAEMAAQTLDRVLVLNGAVTDPAILQDAALAQADSFVATSARDEMNLVAAALAHRIPSGPRVGVVTADPDFVPALRGLDLDLVVNERLITVEAILRFVRLGRYLSVKRLNEQGAELIELSVQKGAAAEGKALKDLKLPRGTLVVAISRDGSALLPDGRSEVRSGDSVVLVALPDVREKAARMFFNKKWLSLQELHLRR